MDKGLVNKQIALQLVRAAVLHRLALTGVLQRRSDGL